MTTIASDIPDKEFVTARGQFRRKVRESNPFKQFRTAAPATSDSDDIKGIPFSAQQIMRFVMDANKLRNGISDPIVEEYQSLVEEFIAVFSIHLDSSEYEFDEAYKDFHAILQGMRLRLGDGHIQEDAYQTTGGAKSAKKKGKAPSPKTRKFKRGKEKDKSDDELDDSLDSSGKDSNVVDQDFDQGDPDDPAAILKRKKKKKKNESFEDILEDLGFFEIKTEVKDEGQVLILASRDDLYDEDPLALFEAVHDEASGEVLSVRNVNSAVAAFNYQSVMESDEGKRLVRKKFAEKITKGMKNAMRKLGTKLACGDCDFEIPRYPGSYPKACPGCGSASLRAPAPKTPEPALASIRNEIEKRKSLHEVLKTLTPGDKHSALKTWATCFTRVVIEDTMSAGPVLESFDGDMIHALLQIVEGEGVDEAIDYLKEQFLKTNIQ